MISDLIREIEEGDTRFDLAFASTTKTLLYRLIKSSLYQQAQRAIAQEPHLVCTFLERAEVLFAKSVEEGYLHPDDMALSIYLYLIGNSPDHDIQVFVRQVAASTNCSFRSSIGVAKYIQAKTPQTTVQMGASSVRSSVSGDWAGIRAKGNKLPSDLSLTNAPSSPQWFLSNHRRLLLGHVRTG